MRFISYMFITIAHIDYNVGLTTVAVVPRGETSMTSTAFDPPPRGIATALAGTVVALVVLAATGSTPPTGVTTKHQ